MNGYQHSKVFEELKGIKESIKGNLSSYQYLSTLDTLMFQLLYPLVDNTKFVDHYLAKILAWQYLNPRRKASSIPRSDLASYITLFLISADTNKRIKYLKKTKLDRGLFMEMVRLWLNVVQPYEALVSRIDLETHDLAHIEQEQLIEARASLKPDHSLFGVYQQVKYWVEHYRKFHGQIVEKYTRMCINQAQQDYVEFGNRVPLDDVIQVYMFHVSKAIDKCDTDKGVLTTHIKNWLKDAKNVVMTSQLGDIAYSLPKNSKTVGKYLTEASSVSLDELVDSDNRGLVTSNDQEQETRSEVDEVRRIAKLMDPVGFGRLTLGIQERLDDDSRRTLHALAAVPKTRSFSPTVNL